MKSERLFWKWTVSGFALLAVLMYLPVLAGKIPFPRDIVLQFAAWNGMAHSEGWQSYADIGDLVTAFYPARALADARFMKGHFHFGILTCSEAHHSWRVLNRLCFTHLIFCTTSCRFPSRGPLH